MLCRKTDINQNNTVIQYNINSMSGKKTFSMIKPGAVRNKHIGHILSKIEEAGYTIAAIKTTRMTLDMAAEFYAVHKERPFYQELIEFMSSGPIVAMVLLKDTVRTATRMQSVSARSSSAVRSTSVATSWIRRLRVSTCKCWRFATKE